MKWKVTISRKSDVFENGFDDYLEAKAFFDTFDETPSGAFTMRLKSDKDVTLCTKRLNRK